MCSISPSAACVEGADKKKECNFVFTEYLLAVPFTVGLIG